MKILFIYTNINGFHEDCYSFGLASIVSITRANGHKCRVVIVREKQGYSEALNAVATFRPGIVGFSSVSSQFNYVKEIAALIKARFPDTITVCGGVHPTINPDCILETGSLDGIFLGESENSFVEFSKKIEMNESYKNTDNLAYVENGNLILNKLKPLITDLDSLPFPDKEVYPFRDTLKTTGFATFLFSRGCPFLCSYCSNHAIAKRYNLPRNYPRYRSPESSILEIEEAVGRFNIYRLIIGDDVFGLDKKWREEFCEKYKKRIKAKFICLLRADLIDEEFIRLLKSVGCYRISIGIESGNEYVRNKIMNRQMSNNQIIKAFDIARAHRLDTNAINIIGLPGETKEMIWDTIRLNRRVKPTLTGVNIFYPYKGTKLGDYCFEKDYVNEDLYHDFSNERRDTVLRFPNCHKKRLLHYRKNWEALVYPFDLKRHLLRFVKRTFIWKHLCNLKRFILLRMRGFSTGKVKPDNKIKRAFGYSLPAIIESEMVRHFPNLYNRIKLKPYFAVLNITDSCCLKCIMCDQWKRQEVSELSSSDWEDILEQLKGNGVKEIIFSGGEPFMRKDLIKIISYANRIGLYIGVFTNGYLLDRETVENAIEAGARTFAISIDAAGERFDDIRGVKGAYKKVIDSCRLLSECKKNGIYIYLYFTLAKATLNCYKEVFSIAEEFNFPFVVNLFDYTPYFFKDLKRKKDIFWVDKNGDHHNLKKLQKDLTEKKNRNSISIYHTYSEIEYFRKYFKDPLQKDIPCVVSQLRIGIDSQGNVYGGCWSMGSFGSLKEKSLEDIINSSKYKLAHKKMFFKNCPGCSCGYSKNLRYHLPSLLKEALFRIAPFTKKLIWR